MSRARRLIPIVGEIGSGKTSWALQRLKVMNPGEKKLIMVKGNPLALASIPRLTTENDLKRFCNGGTGIAQFHPGLWDESRYAEENALALLSSKFRGMPLFHNGAIFIDDGTGWMTATLKREVTQWIIDFKNNGTDIFIGFHDLRSVPPFIRRNATDFCLFKTGADMARKQRDYSDLYEKYFDKLYEAWKFVESAAEIPDSYIQPHIYFVTGVGRRKF